MAAVFIILGVLMITFFLISPRFIAPIKAEFEAITAGSSVYEAFVLDTHREKLNKDDNSPEAEVMIAQFRIEEEKRTVIIKCTEKFFGSYKRGDKISLLFREDMPMDFSMPADDNRFVRPIQLIGRWRLPSLISGLVLIAGGVIMIIM